ncbi:MAG: hypothetical protein ACLU6Y_00580 [Ruminococcus sp.]
MKDGEVEQVKHTAATKGQFHAEWKTRSARKICAEVSYEYGRLDEVHFGEYLNIELYKEEHAELFRI